MAEYVVYFFRRDGTTGHATVHAIDDTEALCRARRIDGVSTVEIWQGRRMVGRVTGPELSTLDSVLPPMPSPPTMH